LRQGDCARRTFGSLDWDCKYKKCACQAQSISDQKHTNDLKSTKNDGAARPRSGDTQVRCFGGGVSSRGWSSNWSFGDT
ncbi:hypothetical protein ACXYUI_32590, partial [Klebsiella pneumoniae]